MRIGKNWCSPGSNSSTAARNSAETPQHPQTEKVSDRALWRERSQNSVRSSDGSNRSPHSPKRMLRQPSISTAKGPPPFFASALALMSGTHRSPGRRWISAAIRPPSPRREDEPVHRHAVALRQPHRDALRPPHHASRTFRISNPRSPAALSAAPSASDPEAALHRGSRQHQG